MKKILVLLSVIAIVVACNSGGKAKKPENAAPAEKEKEAPAATDNSNNPDYQKGLELVAKSDCFTCHKIEERIQGPNYREVAEKYAGATPEVITSVAQKIIKGGSGVWGEAMMTPHPQISQADAETMVRYILLLKK